MPSTQSSTGSSGIKRDQAGSSWIKLDQAGSIDPIDPYWSVL